MAVVNRALCTKCRRNLSSIFCTCHLVPGTHEIAFAIHGCMNLIGRNDQVGIKHRPRMYSLKSAICCSHDCKAKIVLSVTVSCLCQPASEDICNISQFAFSCCIRKVSDVCYYMPIQKPDGIFSIWSITIRFASFCIETIINQDMAN